MNSILIVLSLVFGALFIMNYLKKESQNWIILVSRVFLGIIFIYSGFVKAVDPLGSTYKFIDYFNAFGMGALEDLAFPLAILLSSAEFIIGFGLLFGSYLRLNSVLAALFMLLFTPLTLILAIANPVSDCGCFGDALILTNWQTFWKNIIIDLPIIILLLQKQNIKNLFTGKSAVALNILGLVFIVFVSVYGYQHLPIFDYRPYKIGNNIKEGMEMPEGAKSDVYTSSFTYKNLETQEVKEFPEDQLDEPINHPDKWEFVDSQSVLVEEGYHPPIHDFTITNNLQGDITDRILESDSYTLMLVSYDLPNIDSESLLKLETLNKQFDDSELNALVLTAAVDEQINSAKAELMKQLGYDDIAASEQQMQTVYLFEFEGNVLEFTENELPEDLDDRYQMIGEEEVEIEQEKQGLSYDFFICDPITLKTIVRANAGIVLLKKGTVINKWHYNDFPTLEMIQAEIKK